MEEDADEEGKDRQRSILLKCFQDLLQHSSTEFSSDSSTWLLALERLQAAVRSLGPCASPILVKFLQLPGLPDCVLDALAESIALCCGSCSAPPATVIFKFSPSLVVQIKEMDYVEGGLGWKVWGAALLLAWRLVRQQKSFENKRVLELGSGCGLCGLLMSKLGASEAILSDYVPEILTNLCRNVVLLPAQLYQFNCSRNGTGEQSFNFIYESDQNATSCIVRVRLLDWQEDAFDPILSLDEMKYELQLLPKLTVDDTFDWIIGSDLIYNQYNTRALARVIKRRLSKPHGQGLFAAPVREKKELELFLDELDSLGLETNLEHCTQEEWETCVTAMANEKEGGTFHGVNHYEGGIVVISAKHKI